MFVYRNKLSQEIVFFAATPNWASGQPERYDLVSSTLAPAGAQAELDRQAAEITGKIAAETDRKSASGGSGTNGKTVLNGTVAPTTEGTDGDFYIRTTTNFIYGPKAGGVWPAGVSLVGPGGGAGPTGPTGPTATPSLWTPGDHNLKAWTQDLASMGSVNSLGAAGVLQLARLHVATATNITNIILYCATAGVTLTAGQCFAALYTAAGARVDVTADQAANWQSTGIRTMPLAGGPAAVAAGDYYVGWWSNGTTQPAFLRGVATALANVGLASPNLRFATADTGLTTTAPANFGAQTSASNAWWAALS